MRSSTNLFSPTWCRFTFTWNQIWLIDDICYQHYGNIVRNDTSNNCLDGSDTDHHLVEGCFYQTCLFAIWQRDVLTEVNETFKKWYKEQFLGWWCYISPSGSRKKGFNFSGLGKPVSRLARLFYILKTCMVKFSDIEALLFVYDLTWWNCLWLGVTGNRAFSYAMCPACNTAIRLRVFRYLSTIKLHEE